jgi:hypothetical protein
MRYVAPARGSVAAASFAQPPLADWAEYGEWLQGAAWPTVESLNDGWLHPARWRFVRQTPALLADGLHYEQRIAQRGEIATRQDNWHDLFNALVWLRYPAIKQALNARQMAEIARMGPKMRSRAQYALTHFDEAGVMVELANRELLDCWDAHDWHGLFWRHRQAWIDGAIRVEPFGHALLEHALPPGKLLVGKALVFVRSSTPTLRDSCATAIAAGQLLNDPLELRPLPLSGLPGWHPDNASEAFHRGAACYQPLREGRRYPPPWPLAATDGGLP